MRLLKNYIYNLSYQMVNIIIPVITIPYISRVFNAELLGINSYTASIISYFVLLTNVGITIYGSRTISYYRDDKLKLSKKFWEISLVKLITGSLSFLLLLVFLVIYDKYSNIFFLQSIHILAAILDIAWFFIGLEYFKKILIRNLVIKITSFILIVSLVKNPDDFWIFILITSGSSLLANASLWINIKNFVEPISKIKITILEHCKPILVLFIPQVISTIFISLNKLILGNMEGISSVGYFDNADKLIRILLTIIVSASTVIYPKIANSYKNGKQSDVKYFFYISFNLTTLLSFPVVIGFICISQPFSNLFFGENFLGIDYLISMLALELIFMGWSTVLGTHYLVAINKLRGVTVSISIAIIIMTILSFLLIPIYGVIGGVISSIVSEFIVFFIQLYYVSKYISIVPLFNNFFKVFSASLIMGVGCYLSSIIVSDSLYKITVQIIIGVVLYVLCIFLFKIFPIKDLVKKNFQF